MAHIAIFAAPDTIFAVVLRRYSGCLEVAVAAMDEAREASSVVLSGLGGDYCSSCCGAMVDADLIIEVLGSDLVLYTGIHHGPENKTRLRHTAGKANEQRQSPHSCPNPCSPSFEHGRSIAWTGNVQLPRNAGPKS